MPKIPLGISLPSASIEIKLKFILFLSDIVGMSPEDCLEIVRSIPDGKEEDMFNQAYARVAMLNEKRKESGQKQEKPTPAMADAIARVAITQICITEKIAPSFITKIGQEVTDHYKKEWENKLTEKFIDAIAEAERETFNSWMEIRSLLSQIEDRYLAVEWTSFARNLAILVGFGSLAYVLNIQSALVYSAVTWLIFILLRAPLWKWEIHHTNIWELFFFIRLFPVRWLLLLLCISIVWFRNINLLQESWIIITIVLTIDLLALIFIDARRYAKIKVQATALQSEYDRLTEEYNMLHAQMQIKR